MWSARCSTLGGLGREDIENQSTQPKWQEKLGKTPDKLCFFPVCPWNPIKGAFVSSSLSFLPQDPELMRYMSFYGESNEADSV